MEPDGWAPAGTGFTKWSSTSEPVCLSWGAGLAGRVVSNISPSASSCEFPLQNRWTHAHYKTKLDPSIDIWKKGLVKSILLQTPIRSFCSGVFLNDFWMTKNNLHFVAKKSGPKRNQYSFCSKRWSGGRNCSKSPWKRWNPFCST